MRITDKYVFFWGTEFSNWYPCQIIIFDKGNKLEFRSSEQYFMWLKAKYFLDYETADKILKCITPKKAKQLGREVKNFDEGHWKIVRYQLMYEAIKQKFNQNKELYQKLMSYSGKTFVEASPEDKIWGIGMDENAEGIEDMQNWKGQNLLGFCLTKLRDDFEQNDRIEKLSFESIKKGES